MPYGQTINSMPLTDDGQPWPEDQPQGPPQQGGYWWPQIAQGVWNAVKSGFTLPGDVATGKASMSDPATQARVGDMAGLAMTGGLAGPAEADTLNSGLRAFHASPHDFYKFDISKIGTGEGAQAYSKGLYFAQNPDVMEQYYRNFSQRRIDPSSPAAMAKGIIAAVPDREGAIKELQTRIDSFSNAPNATQIPGWIDKAKSAMDLLKSDWDPYKGAHRYEVEINTHPNRLLDWDKPISQQPPFIQNAMEDVFKNNPVAPNRSTMTGKQAVRAAGILGPGTERYGSEKELAKRGIMGVKYADQLSRGAGEAGTQNYSIWNHNIIDIVRKYGIGALGAVGLAGAASQQGEDQPYK